MRVRQVGNRFVVDPPEQMIVQAILQHLAYSNIPAVHVRNTGNIVRERGQIVFRRSNFDQRGAPDILIAWKGWAIACEVKTATGRIAPHQKEWLDRWEKRGNGRAVVVRSVDDFVKFLEELPAR